MKNTVITALTALAVSLLPPLTNAYELSQEEIGCYYKKSEISMIVPMPKHWTEEQKEKTGKSICDSIEEKRTWNPAESKAVCDTDWNCEVLYDQYKQYGIAKIFVADDEWQGQGRYVVEVLCNDGRTKFANAEVQDELKYVCEDPHKSYENAKKEAEESKHGQTEEWDLDWKEIQVVLDNEPAKRLQNTSNAAPSLEEFRDITKLHPEAEASGIYYKEHGLIIDQIWVRFGSKKYVEQWFLDFCEGSDENPTNNPAAYPGWRCWWD